PKSTRRCEGICLKWRCYDNNYSHRHRYPTKQPSQIMPACKLSYICCEKLGNKEIENEDAYLVPTQSEIETQTVIKLAVSDGATESSFSKEWADFLVSYFKDHSFENENLSIVLDLARKSWSDKIQNIELPWYAQEKLRYGAHASLLG